MRVVTLQINNPKKDSGGASQKLMELIQNFLDNDWEVTHISPAEFSTITNVKLSPYPLMYLPYLSKSFQFTLQTFSGLFKINRANGIDVIVTFSPLECFPAALYKIFNKRVKVITAFHGDGIRGIELSNNNTLIKMLSIQTLRFVEKFVMKRADLVIFVSNYDYKNILKRYNKIKLKSAKVIYNNCNTPRIAELNRAEPLVFEKDCKIIGFVGNLYATSKGIKYLIQAFKEVKNEYGKVKLIIVGTGPDQDYLISQVKNLSLENDVIFVGYQENSIKYIKSFDLLVLPSLHEACPLVILEALYVDTPVIASNVGGIPEMLYYEDLLFEPVNIDSIREKILKILTDESYFKKICELSQERKNMFLFDWSSVNCEAISALTINN